MIKKLTTEAIFVAQRANQDSLDLDSFSRAFKLYFIQRHEEIGLNPFAEDSDKVNRLFKKIAL